jgi:hypothetical protein
MPSGTQMVPLSKMRVRVGGVISTLVVLFLLFDGAIHMLRPAPVVEAFAQLGYPVSLAPGIGLVELACVVIYVIPRTSILGAVVLTGYLGGAIAAQVRVGHPLFTETLFPIYVGVLVWGGLVVRNDQLRTLFPLRR